MFWGLAMTPAEGFLPRFWIIVQTGAALAMVAGVVWWGVVYGQVVWSTGMPAANTLPCLVYTSDLCSLAMALCKDWHILGIKRYSEGLLWGALALFLISAVSVRLSR
jgi:hypothetical protein